MTNPVGMGKVSQTFIQFIIGNNNFANIVISIKGGVVGKNYPVIDREYIDR